MIICCLLVRCWFVGSLLVRCWFVVGSLLVVGVWDAVGCVCMHTPHHAWRRGPALAPGPELHRHVSLALLIITPPLTIKPNSAVLKGKCTSKQRRGRPGRLLKEVQ